MITLSLCMIVKDEEAVLGRILESMRDIADEIIIADTGSEDRTREIAGQYADVLIDYEWKQDFADARNAACSRATKDYWMWLDADDVITEENRQRLLRLKETLDPETDVVMMKYLTGFDEFGNAVFSYDRERMLRNGKGFWWSGRVHEAVAPRGKIVYSPIEIEHRKVKAGDSGRNLRIYENMLAEGAVLEPRHQFYYGRELFYHGRYEEAQEVLYRFLEEKDGWTPNRIEACLQISRCAQALGKEEEALRVLFGSFLYDVPGAEICCEIGGILMRRERWLQAAYWYERALEMEPDENSGAFVQRDCYRFLPGVQLCVCWDRMGQPEKAFRYHRIAEAEKPDSEIVRANREYFRKRLEAAAGS